jgi:CDP-glucose 4,6-dehydratase
MGKDYSSDMDYPLGQHLRELPGPLLLTGHTGFKGTWMTFLLEHLNVPTIGYSLPAEKDSLYDRAERTGAIPEVFADIRDYETLEKFIDLHKPSTIIHMAAQPLVLKSYESPRETFDVNVMGTVNVLDIAFKKDFVKAVIVVTTDKVYRNDNSGRAFVETDPLEGKDPYSASKVGTESVVAAWQQISKVSAGPRVVSVRAGNVIGGGDFAENRIIPDLIRGLMTGNEVEIRNPESTRPWQHALDPLSGYMTAVENCLQGNNYPNFNFGPLSKSLNVSELTKIATTVFKDLKINIMKSKSCTNVESINLDLDSSLVNKNLGWRPIWTQEEAIFRTLNWWSSFLNKSKNADELCKEEVSDFLKARKSIFG